MKKVFLAVILVLAPLAAVFSGQSGLQTVTGTVTTSGTTALVTGISRKRIMVSSYLFVTTATAVNIATMQSGSSSKWTIPMIAPSTTTPFGANLAVPHKQGAIFGTDPGQTLNLNTSASQPLTYSIGYYEED